ncbi:hypothetical protein SAMN04487779_10842 [Belnapia rosea]|uniref:Transposase n=1 Tax=Belnapia rosea TaxID=938405 RepID=A0A1G7EM60_9PROT|nr:hypothetical protein SAMN04487779_10842 [Belnapia rosea]
MTPDLGTYPGYRFPAEIISHAVWLYHLLSLSLRDVEMILAERGITVTHESIRRWVLKFGTDFAARLRKRRPRPGDYRVAEISGLDALIPAHVRDHAMRTYSGRPSSSIRFSTPAAMATSVACRPSVCERSPSPMTRFHREISAPTRARQL